MYIFIIIILYKRMVKLYICHFLYIYNFIDQCIFLIYFGLYVFTYKMTCQRFQTQKPNKQKKNDLNQKERHARASIYF